ncbi:MAG: acetyl-CoA carboxylase biotin carboxyl carrier protein [Bacteroidales bacterium]
MMDIDELKQILEIVREHGITEFELEREDVKLRVKKNGIEVNPELLPARAWSPPPLVPAVPLEPRPAAAAAPAPLEDAQLAIVKSPIVGTFYRAPEPGARPFVEVGTAVRKGQVLCIIEAMKLMNEITSEYDGEVVAAYPENGQAVQYGERLFGIKRV